MFWCKKKKEVLKLTAQEARVITQMQLHRLDFERKQNILQRIKNNAMCGQFSASFVDNRYHHTHEYVYYPTIEKDLEFIKSLGYVIESTEKNQKIKDMCNYYTEYIVKW